MSRGAKSLWPKKKILKIIIIIITIIAPGIKLRLKLRRFVIPEGCGTKKLRKKPGRKGIKLGGGGGRIKILIKEETPLRKDP